MAKKTIFGRTYSQNDDYQKAINAYRNKYYNLYRANFKWTGINYRQEDYIMRKFWGLGTVSAFRIGGIDELGFAPWTLEEWDMYDMPERVLLVNEHGSPLIPNTVQTVDKDVVLGYAQKNKKPLKAMVDWYIERIVQVEMVINTNLNLHKMPFLIPVEDDQAKIEDAVARILNNELVLFVQGADPSVFKAVATGAPYIIDKLHEYKVGLENELKTYLGIDNQGAIEKREQLQLDEINAGNDEINDHAHSILDSMKEFCERIKEVFGAIINVEPTSEPVNSIGEVHMGAKPGPKEGMTDDN